MTGIATAAATADRDGTEYPGRCYRCGADIRPVPAADVATEGGAYVARDGWAWCADWINHTPTPPKDVKPGLWAVKVNETAITFCTAAGVADWWFFRRRPLLEMSGQIREIQAGFGGGLWWLSPGKWELAKLMRDHMIENGVPRSAAKLMRPPRTPQPRRT